MALLSGAFQGCWVSRLRGFKIAGLWGNFEIETPNTRFYFIRQFFWPSTEIFLAIS